MEVSRIKRKIIFHAGHMLKDDKSKCHGRHGHEYVLECTVQGAVQLEGAGAETGMVMHFGILKDIMMEEVHDLFDHKFILQHTDPRRHAMAEIGTEDLVIVQFVPTAENLVAHIFHLIDGKLPDSVRLVKVSLQETSNCTAFYHG